MLAGQDLGGSQERRLSPRVHGRQHGAQRDHGLAGTHLALQQAMHGHLGGQVAGDLIAHLALASGELERQSLIECREQATLAWGSGGGALAADLGPPLMQRDLEDQRLLIPQTMPGSLDLGPGIRGVDPPQGLQPRHQGSRSHDVRGDGIGHAGQGVQHQPGTLTDPPGVHALDLAIHRDEGLALPVVDLVDQRVTRMSELEAAIKGRHLAGEDPAHPGLERLAVAHGFEEDQVELGAPITDGDRQDGPPSIARLEGSRRGDRGNRDDKMARRSLAEVGLAGVIATRPKGQEIADGFQAAAASQGARGPTAKDRGQRGGLGDHRVHSTPMRRG